MRKSNWTPSIVPNDQDQTVYLVADHFGKNGRAWRKTDCETADLETVIQDLLTGQYSNPSYPPRRFRTRPGQSRQTLEPPHRHRHDATAAVRQLSPRRGPGHQASKLLIT